MHLERRLTRKARAQQADPCKVGDVSPTFTRCPSKPCSSSGGARSQWLPAPLTRPKNELPTGGATPLTTGAKLELREQIEPTLCYFLAAGSALT
jgi:hypothetical protein